MRTFIELAKEYEACRAGDLMPGLSTDENRMVANALRMVSIMNEHPKAYATIYTEAQKRKREEEKDDRIRELENEVRQLKRTAEMHVCPPDLGTLRGRE